jgi:hypothetical protein
MIRIPSKRMTTASLKAHVDRRFKSQEQRSNRKFDVVDKRFDAIDKRFDAIDKRLAAVDERFDRLTARMDARFDSLTEKLDAMINSAANHYRHYDRLLNEHEDRITDLEHRSDA